MFYYMKLLILSSAGPILCSFGNPVENGLVTGILAYVPRENATLADMQYSALLHPKPYWDIDSACIIDSLVGISVGHILGCFWSGGYLGSGANNVHSTFLYKQSIYGRIIQKIIILMLE